MHWSPKSLSVSDLLGLERTGTSLRYVPIFGPVTISVKRDCQFLSTFDRAQVTPERVEGSALNRAESHAVSDEQRKQFGLAQAVKDGNAGCGTWQPRLPVPNQISSTHKPRRAVRYNTRYPSPGFGRVAGRSATT